MSPCSSRRLSSRALSSCDSRGLRPAAGSSRQSSTGATHIARAISTPALRAIGQGAGRIVGAIDEADPVEPVAGGLDRRLLPSAVAAKPGKAGKAKASSDQAVMLRDDEIFDQGHALKQADILEGPRDAGVFRDLEIGHALQQENLARGHAGASGAPSASGRARRPPRRSRCGRAPCGRRSCDRSP